MKITKLFALILALCLALPLAACGDGNQTAQGSGEAPSDSGGGAPADSTPSESTDTPVQSDVDYPSGGTLTVIVPVAPGGNMDNVARIATEYLDDVLGCNVIVENIQGNGGIVGAMQYLAEQANTDKIIYMPGNIFAISPLYSDDVGYTLDDYIPIISYNSEVNGVYVAADGPIQSVEDLLNWDPDTTLLYGSSGPGNANHLMQAALYKDMGLRAETVPQDSGAEGIVNVMASTTHIVLSSMSLAEQYVANGDLVCLFAMSDEDYTFRDGSVAPSISSLGYQSADYSLPTLQFFAIRAGTDDAIVEYLNTAFNELYTREDFLQAYADGSDGTLTMMGSEEIQAMLQTNANAAQTMYEKISE